MSKLTDIVLIINAEESEGVPLNKRAIDEWLSDNGHANLTDLSSSVKGHWVFSDSICAVSCNHLNKDEFLDFFDTLEWGDYPDEDFNLLISNEDGAYEDYQSLAEWRNQMKEFRKKTDGDLPDLIPAIPEIQAIHRVAGGMTYVAK